MTAPDAATAVYSCDDHLDLSAVQPDVWQSRLPGALAERGPRVETRDGRSVWVCEDRVIGRSGMSSKSAVAKQLSAIGRAGIEDDGYRAGKPELRLEDMDRDGLAGVGDLRAARARLPDRRPRAAGAPATRAWNDWAVEEFNAVAPDRLCVLAFLPGHSPEAAAAELERCAGLGHRGAIIDVFDVDLGDPAWDRLWAAAADDRAPDQLPHQGRHLVEAQLPDGQVAVGGVRHDAAAAARRAAGDHGVLRRARAAPRLHAGAGGVGHRLAALLPGAHGPRVGGAAATSSTTRRSASRRASCSAAR